MRALVYDGQSIQLDHQRSEPQAHSGDVVIRTLKAGISAIDLAVCRGQFGSVQVPGHEFIGRVERAADEVGKQFVGKRVVGSISTSCGECDMCQGGLRTHCRHRSLLGLMCCNGCFAEQFILPAKNLVAVPDDLDDDHAVFAHPLAAAIQVARQLTIEGKPYITVLGDGPLGLLMVQVMAKLNASVRLIGRHPAKFGLCEKWGIKHRHADDIGRRADQDIVVDCTGNLEGLKVATQLVRPRGTIVMKSIPCVRREADVLASCLADVVAHEIQVIGSFEGPISEAVAMLRSRQVDVVSLITRRMAFEDAASALRTAADAESIKVLLDMSR